MSVVKDYAKSCAEFDYNSLVAQNIEGSPDALNASVECCDRHALPGKVALFYENAKGERQLYTFAELKDQAAQFANFLQQQGVQKGQVVAGLLPKTHELLITILGTWRIGAVYQPLFTAFGPSAIEQRISNSNPALLITDAVNRDKLLKVANCPTVVTVTGAKGVGLQQGDYSFWAEMQRQSTVFAPVMLTLQDPFLLMFTSGTTGAPKPIEVPLKAVVAFQEYMRNAVDLRATDNYWCMADPGWAYGLYFGITGPLALGHPTLFLDAPFTVERTANTVAKYQINNLTGSPTVYRMLMAGGADLLPLLKNSLRVVSSAGEPLNPEVIRWFASKLDVVVHDHYGQTELGMVLCNHHALVHTIHMGAAGYASPGHRVVVLDDEQNELAPGIPGELAVDLDASPLCWFQGYKGMDTDAFKGKYYLTGDTVELNEDGSISFVGRADDVIVTSGYRVGPFEVESALVEHEAVMEAAVVGKPDAKRGEIIKAVVVLNADYKACTELQEALQDHVKVRLAAHAFPREVEFVDSLPKTPSGKVQRFILRHEAANQVA